METVAKFFFCVFFGAFVGQFGPTSLYYTALMFVGIVALLLFFEPAVDNERTAMVKQTNIYLAVISVSAIVAHL